MYQGLCLAGFEHGIEVYALKVLSIVSRFMPCRVWALYQGLCLTGFEQCIKVYALQGLSIVSRFMPWRFWALYQGLCLAGFKHCIKIYALHKLWMKLSLMKGCIKLWDKSMAAKYYFFHCTCTCIKCSLHCIVFRDCYRFIVY